MKQEENQQEKIPSRKGIVAWVKEILQRRDDTDPLPEEPQPEVVTSLIARASDSANPPANPEIGGNPDDAADHRNEEEADDDTDDGNDGNDGDDGKGDKKSCSYALKRNIVASLREIRKFAEEHQLAATMVKALLSLLAEMALNALRGKVNMGVLDNLLKIFNHEKAVAEAYRQGELDGRNARIREEIFPEETAGIPHFKDAKKGDSERINIFAVAEGN